MSEFIKISLIGMLILFNILDFKVTNQLICKGGIEINPVVKISIRLFKKHWWITKVITIAPIIILCIFSHLKNILSILVFLNTFYILVVFNNLIVVRKLVKLEKNNSF